MTILRVMFTLEMVLDEFPYVAFVGQDTIFLTSFWIGHGVRRNFRGIQITSCTKRSSLPKQYLH
jgi:hypothetical protein